MRNVLFFALLVLGLANPIAKLPGLEKTAPNFELMVFTRPTTCFWCAKFEEEILSRTIFQDSVQGKIKITRSTSRELEEKYNITGVPTLILLTEKGDEITRLGYIPLSPEGFAEHLLKICSSYQAVAAEMEGDLFQRSEEELHQLYYKAAAIPCDRWKEKLLSVGLEKDKGVFFLLEKYAALKSNHSKKARDIRLEIYDRDKDHKEGSRLSLAVIDAESRIANNEPNSNVVKPLKRYLEKFGDQEKKYAWQAHLFLSQYLIRGENWQEATLHAKKAFELAPAFDKQGIEKTLAYLKEKTS